MAQIANTYNDYDSKNFKGSFELNYEFVKDLTITGRLGYDLNDSNGRTFSPEISYGGKVFDNVRSRVDQNQINNNMVTFDGFLNYTKNFAETHNFDVMVGMTIWKNFGQALFASGFDVPNNSWQFADIGLTTGYQDAKTANSYKYDQRRLSYFARINYNFKEKYYLSAMFRRDNSTKFGQDKRVAYFPSVTGGWVVSNEPFFGDSNVVNFLKLRASYGILGNDLIGDYLYSPALTGEATYVIDGQLVNGVATGVVANPYVQWEEARKFDVGADINFLNNKLSLTADYFRDKRAALLIPGLPTSGIIGGGAPGSGAPTVNAGDVINKGLEFGLTYKDQIGEDFKFSAFYNVTFIDNEVTRIDGADFLQGGAFGVGQPFPTRMEVGQPLGYFYGYQTDGLFQSQAEVDAHPSQAALGAPAQPGDIRFVDTNGDGVINTDDRTNIGDPIPDATMGFNLQLEYKGFDFVAFAFASLGNDMIRNYERTQPDVNRMNFVLDRWTGPGTSNTVPRVTTAATANNVFSDYFVEDASYCRIQNVQLGYTVNPDFTKKAGIDKLRVYAGVNNLYTFTKYRGFDPGASSGDPLSSGIDYGFYPVPRTYMFGVNFKF